MDYPDSELQEVREELNDTDHELQIAWRQVDLASQKLVSLKPLILRLFELADHGRDSHGVLSREAHDVNEKIRKIYDQTSGGKD